MVWSFDRLVIRVKSLVNILSATRPPSDAEKIIHSLRNLGWDLYAFSENQYHGSLS